MNVFVCGGLHSFSKITARLDTHTRARPQPHEDFAKPVSRFTASCGEAL
jgi:hypothetical protein